METQTLKNWYREMAPKLKFLGILFLVFSIALSVFQYQEEKQLVDRYINNEKTYQAAIAYYTNKNGTLTAAVGTAQMTIAEYKDQVLSKDLQLKNLVAPFHKISNVTQFQAQGKIDTFFIPFKEPIVCKDNDSIKLSDKGIKKDWLTFDYSITNKGIGLSNITAEIPITTVTGVKRKWIFGREYASTEVTPMITGIKITDLKSTDILIPKKIYQTNGFWAGVGAAAVIVGEVLIHR